MNRKKFIRNLAGTVAAVIIGKQLAPLLPNETLVATYYGRPDVPGIGGELLKVFVNKGWFHRNDIITMSSPGKQFYLCERDGRLIGLDLITGEPKIELVERVPYQGLAPVYKLASAIDTYVTT